MRTLRLILVFLANATAVYFFYSGAQQVALLNHLLEQDSRNNQVWLSFALKAAIPIMGLFLEAINWRVAKWLNVTYFAVVGALLLTTGLLNWSDYHGRVYLLFGSCALLIAAVTYLLYRPPRAGQSPT